MILKNKAPSLKTNIKSGTISENLQILQNTINFDIINVIPKDEVMESSITYITDSDTNFKHFNEFSDINLQLLTTNMDLVNNNLPNALTFSINEQTISIDVIETEDNPVTNGDMKKTDSEKVNHVDMKSTNHKRKIPNNCNEYQSKESSNKKSQKKIGKFETKSDVINKPKIVPPKSLDSGVYVECDLCHKTRYLKDVFDPSELPSFWTCDMEISKKLNCDILQDNFEDSVDYFINNKYTLGSVVWAKLPGFCWWPAIIDEDPDLHLFYWCYENSNDVSHYHVTFLDDDVSRSWINNKDIKVFRDRSDMNLMKFPRSKKDYLKILNKAVEKADECLKLSLQDCLDKYSFAVRYTGKPNMWTSPDLPSVRKTKSKNNLESSDSEESETDAVLQSGSFNKTKTKKSKIKFKDQSQGLNTEIEIQESKNEGLLNQQTKHDLILKKENKIKKKNTKSKTDSKNQKLLKSKEK